MKKLKGFTLVELIVVLAIFSMIMAAVLSLLNPVANVYSSTANYEHARAASDNVRLYIEDNLKYANNLRVLYNATDATAANSSATAMADKFATYTEKPPVYIMEIDNANNGKITIYKGSVSSGTKYKEINENLYSDYKYEFSVPMGDENHDGTKECTFGVSNAVLDITAYRYVMDSGSKIIPPETDSRFYKLSTASTFSFVNLRNIQAKLPIDTEVKYLNIEGEEVGEHDPGAIKIDATKPETNPYAGCDDTLQGGKNIYFVYTLPKFANEY